MVVLGLSCEAGLVPYEVGAVTVMRVQLFVMDFSTLSARVTTMLVCGTGEVWLR